MPGNQAKCKESAQEKDNSLVLDSNTPTRKSKRLLKSAASGATRQERTPGSKRRDRDNSVLQSLENLSVKSTNKTGCSPRKKSKSPDTDRLKVQHSFSPTKCTADESIISFYSPTRPRAVRSLFTDDNHKPVAKASTAEKCSNEESDHKPKEQYFKSPTKSPRRTAVPSSEISSDVRQSPRKLDYCSPLRLARRHEHLYQQAKQLLHTGLPEVIVGREEQQEKINTFLDQHLKQQKPGSLYISGVPGTGKTAVISAMLRSLQPNKKYRVAYVNCMGMHTPCSVYQKIITALKSKHQSTCCSNKTSEAIKTKEATKAIETAVTAGNPILLVADEVDQLRVDILYTIFEWPSLKNSRLVLIGIANALDLTERILPRLQTLREFKPKHINFAPYTKAQIVSILEHRLQQMSSKEVIPADQGKSNVVFQSGVLQFIASKVSANDGDLRKALDVCRRTIEVVQAEARKKQLSQPVTVYNSPKKLSQVEPKRVTMKHVLTVMNAVYGSTSQSVTIGMPLHYKLMMCAQLIATKASKKTEETLAKVYDSYCKLCRKHEKEAVRMDMFLSICDGLSDESLLDVKKNKKNIRDTKLSMRIDKSEFEHRLQDDQLILLILKEELR